jgi:hypothetical protein
MAYAPRNLDGPALKTPRNSVDRFMPVLALNRGVRFDVRSGQETGFEWSAAGVAHSAKLAAGNNRLHWAVDFEPDGDSGAAWLIGEANSSGVSGVYVDGADLLFVWMDASGAYRYARWKSVRVGGERFACQTVHRVDVNEWYFNIGPCYGGVESFGAAQNERPQIITGSSGVPTMAALASSVGRMGKHGGTIPAALTSDANLITGTPTGWSSQGVFPGLIYAAGMHPSTANSGLAEEPHPGRGKLYFAFGALGNEELPQNVGVCNDALTVTKIGNGTIEYEDFIRPPTDLAVDGNLQVIRDWLDSRNAGENPLLIILTDSTGGASDGGHNYAARMCLAADAAAGGKDGRPTTVWMYLSQPDNLAQRFSFGAMVSANDLSTGANDIKIVSGSGGTYTATTSIGTAGSMGFDQSDTLEEEACAFGGRYKNSGGVLFNVPLPCLADTAEVRWGSMDGWYTGASNNLLDGRLRSGALSASGGWRRSDLFEAGDLIAFGALVPRRRSGVAGGQVQFATRVLPPDQVSDGTYRSNAGRLVTRAGTANTGWLTVDPAVNTVDAQREAIAAAIDGLTGQPLRPATFADWSTPSPAVANPDAALFDVKRTCPFVVHETTVPGSGISLDAGPSGYDCHFAAKTNTIVGPAFWRLYGNLRTNEPRLGYELWSGAVGGTTAAMHAGYFWPSASARNGVAPRTGTLEQVLRAMGAPGKRVLFICEEDQNSGGLANGVAADAMDDTKNNWAGYTGAVQRALQQACANVGVRGDAYLRFGSAMPAGQIARNDVMATLTTVFPKLVTVRPYRLYSDGRYWRHRRFMFGMSATGVIDTAHCNALHIKAPMLAHVFGRAMNLASASAAGGGISRGSRWNR